MIMFPASGFSLRPRSACIANSCLYLPFVLTGDSPLIKEQMPVAHSSEKARPEYLTRVLPLVSAVG